MASLENVGSAGALMPVLNTRYDRPALERALRSTWNLRNRRPRVGGAERQIFRGRPLVGVFWSEFWLHAVARIAAPTETRPGRAEQIWLRGLLPAGFGQRVVVTFDSWHNAQTRTEITTDALGAVTIANLTAARAALKTVDSGHSVVVQVCSMPEPEDETRPTIRVWVCNRKYARAVDATTLEQNRKGMRRADPAPSRARFETGWIVTGEPGGARRRSGKAPQRAH